MISLVNTDDHKSFSNLCSILSKFYIWKTQRPNTVKYWTVHICLNQPKVKTTNKVGKDSALWNLQTNGRRSVFSEPHFLEKVTAHMKTRAVGKLDLQKFPEHSLYKSILSVPREWCKNSNIQIPLGILQIYSLSTGRTNTWQNYLAKYIHNAPLWK